MAEMEDKEDGNDEEEDEDKGQTEDHEPDIVVETTSQRW